jgi:Prion-inhibition and propagation
MAEAAGLDHGAESLSGLVSSCVELTEYISLARNVGSDYEAAYTKFLLLRSRLIASGNQLNLTLEGHTVRANEDLWEPHGYSAARNLLAVRDLLENSHELEQKYGLRQ